MDGIPGDSRLRPLVTFENFKLALGVAFGGTMLVLNTLITMTSMKKMGLFLAFVMCLVFLQYPIGGEKRKGGKPTVADWILAALGASVGLYTFFFIDSFFERYFKSTRLDIVFGVLAIVLIIEAGRRVLGPVLPVLAVVSLVYVFFGNNLTGLFRTAKFSFPRIVEFLYMRAEGIYGVTLQTATSYIALFIIFGAIINETRVGEYLIELSQTLAGRATGGPAKVAVISSALMGTVSGSPIANVVTTGTFTIPLMKKIGFEDHMAGATEAAASTGGSLMPPVMASAAFIMAEYLGISYLTIALAALIPALCYYISIFVNVHFYSKMKGLTGVDEVPPWKSVLKETYLLVPLAVVFIVIFSGRTALNAALWGIVSTVAVSQVGGSSRITPKKFLKALGKSSLTGLEAYVACIIVGIPVGVIVMTNLGRVFADLVVGISGSQIYIVLILSALAALLMSMGLPTVPLYIICATTIAPALVSLGVAPIAAHMFVLYWGVLSNLTPPVALASYAAAGLSGGSLNKVAWTSVKLTLPTFLIPFAFVLNPGILLQGASVADTVRTTATLVIGSCALAIAIAGYTRRKLKPVERIVLAAGAIMAIDPNLITDIAGMAIIAVAGTVVFLKPKAATEAAAAGNQARPHASKPEHMRRNSDA